MILDARSRRSWGHPRPDHAAPTPPTAPRQRPNITLGALIEDSANAIREGIRDHNDPPHLFQRDGRLVRLVGVDDRYQIEDLTRVSLRTHLTRHFRAMKMAKNKETGDFEAVQTDITQAHAEFVLAEADHPVPILDTVRTMPAFAPDGSLRQTPGYDPGLRCFLDLSRRYDVPLLPTARDVEGAHELIDELLCDFKFPDSASRANAIAYGILPLVRSMIQGPTPLHVIASNAQGAGKGLLASALGEAATGRRPNPIPLPREDAEVSKTITTALRTGAEILMWDNLDTKVMASSLAVVLTAWPVWDARLLGSNNSANLKTNVTWVATGNDVQLSTDLARRSVLCKIETGLERPWERQGFRHDLSTWVPENQHRLWRALAILVQNWVAAGMPAGRETIGSFEDWSRKVGGILEVNEIEGFLANREEMYITGDAEAEEWRAFFGAWCDKYGAGLVSVSQLYSLAHDDGLIPLVLGDRGELSQTQRLGRALRRIGNGRIHAGLRCIRDRSGRHPQYRLERIGQSEERVTEI